VVFEDVIQMGAAGLASCPTAVVARVVEYPLMECLSVLSWIN
jgi:hypothetical protein